MSQNYSEKSFENSVEIQAKRCLLIGSAPPSTSNTSRHLVRLLHMLRATGAKAHVASIGPSPLIERVLNFSNAADSVRSTSEVTSFKADRVFLYASALNFGDCKQGNWLGRRLEELRRLRFAFQIGQLSAGVTLICDPLNYRLRTQAGVVLAAFIGALIKRRRIGLKFRTRRMGGVAPDVIDQSVPAPDPVVAESAFYAQCKTTSLNPTEARLTPAVAQQALFLARQRAGNPVPVDFLDEVQMLTDAMRDHACDHLPIVRILRRQSLHSSTDVAGQPVSAAYQIANCLSPEGSEYALPITQFMKHLRLALRLEDAYPLTTRNGARAFLSWYRDKGPAKSCGGALPEPLPALTVPPHSATLRGRSGNWGRLGQISDLDARPFPVPPAFLVEQECLPNGRFDLERKTGRIAWAFEQVLRRINDPALLDELGSAALEWLATPIAGRPGNVSRFEYMMALQCRRCLCSGQDFLMPWLSEATQGWYNSFALARSAELARFSSKKIAKQSPGHRLDIVGLGQQTTGIAVNFEMSQSALQSSGLPVLVRDAEVGYARMDKGDVVSPVVLGKSAALFHLNADRIPQALVAPAFSTRADLYNIGYLLWEFSQLPESHALALEMLDEIWVPTTFLQRTYSAASYKPVMLIGKGLHLPDVDPCNLSKWGLRQASTTFLTCFDFHSSVERKNPLAAVRAFQTAFPSRREDVQLLVKTTPKIEGHWGDPEDQLGQIRKLARWDRRIKILSQYQEKAEFLSLIRSIDCLISPHRAEGFGYIPAYALYYGVPVVNTDYSGVTDYCTPQTAFPVPYELVDVPQDHAIYPLERARWADVSVDALAGILRNIAANPLEARQRAMAGQSLMKSYYSIPALRDRYLRRFSEIGLLEESDLNFCSRNVHAQE